MLHMDSGSQCEVMIENLSSESMQINKPDLSSIDVAKLLIGPIGGAPIGDLLAYDYEGGVFGGGDAEMTLPPGGILILTEPIFPLSNGLLDNRGRRVAIEPGRYAIVVEILDGLTASKGTLPTGRVLGKSDSIPITLIEGTQAGNNP